MKVLPHIAVVAQARHAGPITSHVFPVQASLATDRNVLCYHLRPMHSLPSFDSRRLLQSRLCTSSQRLAWNQFMRKHTRLVTFGYFVGLVYRLYGLVIPIQFSGGNALLFAGLLQLPAVLTTTLSLCSEFLAHMTQTFEFWYFGLTNTLGVVGLAAVFQDMRASLCFVTWLEIENARLADAYCTASSSMSYIVGVAGFGALYFSGIAFAVALQVIEVNSVILWHTPRGLKLRLEDMVVSSFATVGLLMSRIAFRKRNALRRTKGSVEVECISYHCRLEFVAGEPTTRRVRSLTASFDEPWRVQLHEIVEPHVFEAFDIILKCVWDLRTQDELPRWARSVWLLLLVIGASMLLGLCISAFRMPLSAQDQREDLFQPFIAGTIIAHVLAATPFVALQHYKLLRRLFTSFDYIFLSVSVFSASATWCYLCRWRPDHCAIQFCLCLWFYVAITSDSLVPTAKRRLHCSSRHQAALVFFLLAAQVILVLEITVFGQLGLSDRTIFDHQFFFRERSYRVTISSFSFLLTKMSTTITWTAQILWILWFSKSDYNDLILLQGGAEYAQARRHKRRDGSQTHVTS